MFDSEEQRTLMIVKPDGVQRGLVGEVISRVERRGLKIIGLKMIWMDKALAEAHYAVHKERDFFPKLVKFIISSPVVIIAVEGYHAVNLVRRMMGALDPDEAARGSIRGDLALIPQKTAKPRLRSTSKKMRFSTTTDPSTTG